MDSSNSLEDLQSNNNSFSNQDFNFVERSQKSQDNLISNHEIQLNLKQQSKNPIIKIDPLKLVENRQSKYLQNYLQFFKDVQYCIDSKIDSIMTNQQLIRKYNLIIIDSASWNKKILSYKQPFIIITSIQQHGTIINYEVIIGAIKLQLKLLNLIQQIKTEQIVGKGTYGRILKINCGEDQIFVAKRINFPTNQIKLLELISDGQQYSILPKKTIIHQSLCEYAIYKICSLFQIGPKVLTNFGFDLLCFNNCVEFYMQYCLQIKTNYKQLEKDLKICLGIMHKFKIIHKDIKPSNVLYSPTYKKFVLSDFGISHPIVEDIGSLTKTAKQGTCQYMGDEMSQIQKIPMEIDLYYNDVQGLIYSMIDFRRNKLKYLKNSKLQNDNQQKYLKNFSSMSLVKQPINIFYLSLRLFYYLLYQSQINKKSIKKYLFHIRKDKIHINNLLSFLSKNTLNFIKQKIQSLPNFDDQLSLTTSFLYSKISIDSISKTQFITNQNSRPRVNQNNILFQFIQMIQNLVKVQKNNQVYLEFLLRGFGFDCMILQHLNQMRNNERIDKIYKKIDKRISKSYVQLQRIQKLQYIFGQNNRIVKILQRNIYISEYKLKNNDLNQEEKKNQTIKILNYLDKLLYYKLINSEFFQENRQILTKFENYIRICELKEQYKMEIQLNQFFLNAENIEVTQQQLSHLFKYNKISYQQIQKIVNYFYIKTHILNQGILALKNLLAFIKSNYQKIDNNQWLLKSKLYNIIANIYFKNQNYLKAQQYFQQSINLQIVQKREKQIYSLKNLINLGDLRMKQYKYNQALEYYESSLNIIYNKVGSENPQIIILKYKIADVYLLTNKYQQAQINFCCGLQLQKRIVGQLNSLCFDFYLKLAITSQKLLDNKKCTQHFKKCLEISKFLCSSNNLNLILKLIQLCRIYYKIYSYNKQINQVQQSLQSLQQCLKQAIKQSKIKKQQCLQQYLIFLNDRALFQIKLNNFQKAKIYFLKFKQIQKEINIQNDCQMIDKNLILLTNLIKQNSEKSFPVIIVQFIKQNDQKQNILQFKQKKSDLLSLYTNIIKNRIKDSSKINDVKINKYRDLIQNTVKYYLKKGLYEQAIILVKDSDLGSILILQFLSLSYQKWLKCHNYKKCIQDEYQIVLNELVDYYSKQQQYVRILYYSLKKYLFLIQIKKQYKIALQIGLNLNQNYIIPNIDVYKEQYILVNYFFINIYYQLNEFQKVLQIYRKNIENIEKCIYFQFTIYERIANCIFMQKKYNQAAQIYKNIQKYSKNQQYIIKNYYQVGIYYLNLNLKEGDYFLQKSIQILQNNPVIIKHWKFQLFLYWKLAHSYAYHQNKIILIKSYYQKSIQIAISNHYQNTQKIYQDFANALFMIKQYNLSIFYYKQALNLYETTNEIDTINQIYENLIKIFVLLENNMQLIFYCNKILVNLRSISDKQQKHNLNITISLSILGDTYYKMNMLSESFRSYQQSLQYIKQLKNNNYKLESIYKKIFKVFQKQHNQQKCIQFCNKIIQIQQSQMNILRYKYILANIYFKFKNYQSSLDKYLQLLKYQAFSSHKQIYYQILVSSAQIRKKSYFLYAYHVGLYKKHQFIYKNMHKIMNLYINLLNKKKQRKNCRLVLKRYSKLESYGNYLRLIIEIEQKLGNGKRMKEIMRLRRCQGMKERIIFKNLKKMKILNYMRRGYGGRQDIKNKLIQMQQKIKQIKSWLK